MRGNIKHVFSTFFVGVGLIFLLLLLISHTQAAFADPVTLFVALDGDDANTCANIIDRCATVQRAVDVAQLGDVIRVAEGVYTDVSARVGITQVVYITKSVHLQGGYTTDNWDIANPSANPTTLDAQGHGRVVVIQNASPTLQGFVFTGGAGFFSGGGIYVNNGSPFIFNNHIWGNSADGDGGGIWVNRGNAEIANNHIYSNTANWGGGLRIINDANAVVVRNRIEANAALISGGGISLECCGGVVPLISENTISGNHAGAAGGGVWDRTAHARLVNNILVGNQAGSGDGLWLEGTPTHPVTVTMFHNTLVGGTPGAVGVWSSAYVAATLVNNILVDFGTGITNTVPVSSSVSLDFTLFYNNNTDYGPDVSSTNEVHGDPAFVNVAVDDYHIGPGSAAIDIGGDAGVADDYDGEPRPFGPGFDLGADEIVKHIFLPLILRIDQP